MQVWQINNEGFFTGESYFIDEPIKNEITTPILIGYVKPKWNGIEWTEGATEREIEEWEEAQRNQPRELTEIEKLKISQAEQFETILELLGGM